ncbi:hypothetical protein GTW25_19755 [Aliihoeflea aestuarii]|uniref:hypothetical protein n=1 Tax=Aliihoeflea aestuarii TaxID=453840 RepID=UPI002094A4CD|nr:hypothetical protein [Aliihoeflea aestuarii]MCO6393258.1 hypothetical protein [Aliihoeflea aestuarii]
MQSIGFRLTEDHTDFWFFGTTDDGFPTQAYLGVEGLHRLLGEMRKRQLRIVHQLLDSEEVREALRNFQSEHWLVIDLATNGARYLAFASADKRVDDGRYETITELRAAVAEPVKPRFP